MCAPVCKWQVGLIIVFCVIKRSSIFPYECKASLASFVLLVNLIVKFMLLYIDCLDDNTSVSDPDPLHLAGSGSSLILASNPDPDPLRFLFPDPDPAKCSGSGWNQDYVEKKVKLNVFYLRNAFSKFWQ